MYSALTTHGLALDPKGQRLAAVGPGYGAIFEVTSGQAITSWAGSLGHAYDVDYSPDGLSIAVCSHGGHLRRYDATTGELLMRYQGHSGVPDGVRKVAFEPGGRRLASVAEDSTLRVWGVDSGEQEQLFKDRADVNAVAWGPAPDQLVFASDVGLSLVHLGTRRGRAMDTGPIADVHVHQGRIYAAWGEAIRVLDDELRLIDELPQANVSRIRRFKDLLFASSWQGPDQGIWCWRLPTRTRHALFDPAAVARPPKVWALALDPSQALLYAGVTPNEEVTEGILRWSIGQDGSACLKMGDDG